MEVRHGGERNGFPVAGHELQILQCLNRAAFGVARSGENIHQVDVITNLRDVRAADDAIHRLRNGLGSDAELSRLVLQHLQLHDARRFHPVEADIFEQRMGADLRRQLLGEFSHFLHVGSADAILHRPSGGRAHGQKLHLNVDADEFALRHLLELRPQPVARGLVLTDNDDLPIARVWHLDVESEHETNRALSDVGGPTIDILVAGELAFKAVHRGFGRGNRGVLRQREIHDEFTPRRWRKELLRDKLHSK